MDSKTLISHQKLKIHPQQKWNFIEAVFGNMFFCWTIPVFIKGFKKDLSNEDLYQTLNEHEANRLANKLEKALNNQKNKSKPSLVRAVWTVFKWDIILNVVTYLIIELVISTIRPLALGRLMGYYDPDQEISKNDAIIYASLIIIATFIYGIVNQVFILHFIQISLKVRVAFSSLIYRKALRLSKSTLHQTTVGHIINLLSNDMQRIVEFWTSYNALWSVPPQAVLILYLLYLVAGPTALVGVVFIAILVPIQMYMSKMYSVYRLKISLKTDERIRYMNEIISGIQVIKVYAWENSFIKLIDSIRRKEMKLIKLGNYIDAFTISFSFFIDRVAIFLCILTYVLTGSSLKAQYAFVISSFYDMLMISVSLYFPQGVNQALQAKVAMKRLENFLNLEEIQNQVKISDKAGIRIENASAKWSTDSAQNTLTDISFEAKPNELVAIVGPIGSGKSSLLQMCLSEISVLKGNVEIGGTISYASQEPWLFAGTVKKNILFGEPMIKEKYNEVIRVCALEEDIAQFPFGDNTIVGERGILLSGGQKARITLARAIYKEADIYLLDDPLSAVDASVGKQIFYNCIRGYLKNKCTVLVTHQIQHLTSVDKIYLVTNGTITVSGTYQDLQKCGEDFTKVLNNTESIEEAHEAGDTKITTEVQDQQEQDEEEEERKSGKVSGKVYSSYIRASGSYVNSFILIVLFILTEILATGTDYYVSFWVNLEQDRTSNNISSNSTIQIEPIYAFFTQENCIYIYTIIISALIICCIYRSFSFFKSCMRASVKLHNEMFSNVVHAVMTFFYTNSSGRILNRFSKDIGHIDETLPEMFMDTIGLTFAVVGTALAICLVSPWTIIPTLIIFLIMFGLRAVYMASSRDLKRLEATNRSPILAHLTESMKGLTTIRAFDAKQTLQREFNNYQNVHSSAFYLFLCCRRAFATWLDMVCVVYVLMVTIISLINEKYGGNVGFVLTQAMSLTNLFQWAVRQWSELENNMTSVERVIEYTNIDRESDKETKEPSVLWPDQGKIEFHSVFLQYSPNNPYVLKNLNIIIQPKEKIGIVGRTGAGKSSLISVLFRLINFEGEIYIDNINTNVIPLSSLRSKISIIPQDPVLFSGSVRKNLDPFDDYQDDQIWKALKDVKLGDFISTLPLGLHSNLAEGGSNFSVGQKQLICLARALLRNNKILVLDEATANVDHQTDELLQKTIREKFANCTVLTIAHRLHTVMDSDKVLVMDDGFAVEFDRAYKLLQKKGTFYNLVMKTGKQMGENLSEIAQKTYFNTDK